MAESRSGGGMVNGDDASLKLQAQGSSNTRVRLGLANTIHVILISNGLRTYQQNV